MTLSPITAGAYAPDRPTYAPPSPSVAADGTARTEAAPTGPSVASASQTQTSALGTVVAANAAAAGSVGLSSEDLLAGLLGLAHQALASAPSVGGRLDISM